MSSNRSTPTVKRLIDLWSARCYLQLESTLFVQDPYLYQEVMHLVSPQGRAATVAKLRPSLVKINCELASMQARSLLLPYTRGLQQVFHKSRMALGATILAQQ
jgi:hypothetical protein